MPKTCSFDNCERPVFSTGYCQSHWRSEIGSKKNYLSGSNNVSKGNNCVKNISETRQLKLANDIQDKKDMAAFLQSMTEFIPRICMECGQPFGFLPAWRSKWVCAHILPKQSFKSVKLNPDNIFYLCTNNGCHGLYDDRGRKDRRKMNCYKLAVERVESFYHLLTDHEQVLLTDYL